MLQTHWNLAGVAGNKLVVHFLVVYHNSTHRPLVKVPPRRYSDAIKVFSDSGALFPVNGTYWDMDNLLQAHQCRLEAAFLAILAGADTEWQQEHILTVRLITRRG